MIVTLAGGVGAARLLVGMQRVVPDDLIAVVNVGDDTELHGLHISPDIDTVTYTLAGAINPETGWGLAGESWHAMEALERYGGLTWFRLGDKDLATHLYRTQQLAAGEPLSAITDHIARAWELGPRLIPVTDDRLRTMVTLDSGEDISFQEYFVKHQHSVAVSAIRFDGAEQATPAPGVIDAMEQASAIVIAPSNPIVSIGPLLAIDRVSDTLRRRRDQVVAVSPIIGGKALKGPADRLLRELGHDSSVLGVARLYADIASVLVIDETDAALAPEVEAIGIRCVVTPTIMSSPDVAATLSQTVLESVS